MAIKRNFLTRILPSIFATVTRHDRELVEFVWVKTSLVASLFRMWEFFFGRRAGIRRESSVAATSTESGLTVITQKFYTVEALLVHFEASVREFLRNPYRLEWVQVPQLAYVGAGMRGRPDSKPIFVLAIARDSTSSGSAGGATSVTVAHTCTGSNVLLLAFCYNEGNETGLSATYNGVAMTQSNRLVNAGNGTFEYVYGIVIGTGDGASHNTIFGSGNNATRSIVACSYTGAQQSTTMDSTPAPQAQTTTTLTNNFTTVANNAWVFGGGYASNGQYNASTNATVVVNAVGPNSHVGAVDNQTFGPITPAGSFAISVANSGGSGLISFTGVSFAPAGAAVVSSVSSHNFTLLGVGS